MSVKRNSQRVFILVIVAVFFLTALGSTVFVIYDSVRNKDAKSVSNNTEDIQKQLDQLKAENGNEQQIQPQEGKLQGTKLADFTPVDKVSSLQKIDLVQGTGAEVPAGATVTAHYTGALAKDGTIFQSSHDMGQPIPFGLNQVIKGWTDGVPGMKEGGKRRLLIPADQAYGANAPQGSGIPNNADLVFDIEIVKIGE